MDVSNSASADPSTPSGAFGVFARAEGDTPLSVIFSDFVVYNVNYVAPTNTPTAIMSIAEYALVHMANRKHMTYQPTNIIMKNKLNNITNKEWLKFQKSWFIHNPPPRKKGVLVHPAKFPETMAQEFIEFFTKEGETVLDPMAGTGSTLIAALRAGRNSYGIELNPKYAKIAQEIIEEERNTLGEKVESLKSKVINGDASLATNYELPITDYVLTSPPYWDMLRAKGAETQKKRRSSAELDVTYSDDPNDMGNISDYEEFLEKLVQIYEGLQTFTTREGLPDDHCQEYKKGREDLSAGMGHRPRTRQDLHTQR